MYGKKPVAEGRRPQGRQDARAGDGDRRHDVPGLRRAGRAHAVRRGLHVAADRRRRHGRERHQQLPHQQALRGRAGAVADRARGQQRRAVRQRQGVEQPHRRAEEMGAGGGRRGQPERADRGLQARARGAGEAREDRRQGRQGRRQERLRADQQADPGQARLGSRARNAVKVLGLVRNVK